jgi:hypothetical protein
MRGIPGKATGIVLAIFVLCSITRAADPDEVLAKRIETARDNRLEAYRKAKEKLVAGLTDEINQVRARPAKADEKVQLIENLTREKEGLVKDGRLPFSPAARRVAIAYLKDLRAADAPVAAAYDDLITLALKKRDDKAAEEYSARKREALAPIMLGKWNMKLPGSTWKAQWVLWSDGHSGPGQGCKWTLETAKLILVCVGEKEAPKEGWINTGVVSPDGMKMDAPNQHGDRVTGELEIAK